MRLLRKLGCNHYIVAQPCPTKVRLDRSVQFTLGHPKHFSYEDSKYTLRCDALGEGVNPSVTFDTLYYTWALSTPRAGISVLLRDEDNVGLWAHNQLLECGSETKSIDRIVVDQAEGWMFVLAQTAVGRNNELRRYPLAPADENDYTVLIQDTDLIVGVLSGALDVDRTNKRLYVASGPLATGSGLIAEYSYAGAHLQTLATYSETLLTLAGCGFDGADHIYYHRRGLGDDHLYRVSISTGTDEELIVDNVAVNPEVYVANKAAGYLVTINYGTRNVRYNTIPTLGSYTTIANAGAAGMSGLTVDWDDLQAYYPASQIGREPVTGGTTEVVSTLGLGNPIISIDTGVG